MIRKNYSSIKSDIIKLDIVKLDIVKLDIIKSDIIKSFKIFKIGKNLINFLKFTNKIIYYDYLTFKFH